MIRKYPRTPHIAGSHLQPGDEDLEAVPFSAIAGRHVVVEEKMDGANCALSFDADGALRLQSRGHFLTGGPRKRRFALLKQWAHTHAGALIDVLADRYVCYGEWLYAKHTLFYDALPHYFMEFDVLDKATDTFLGTPARAALLLNLPIVSVRVLYAGPLENQEHLKELLGASIFKTAQATQRLRGTAADLGLDPVEIENQTDLNPLMEGLYVKVEEEGVVCGRYKFVRHDFLTRIVDADSHWLSRPIIPNRLRDDADIFSSERAVPS